MVAVSGSPHGAMDRWFCFGRCVDSLTPQNIKHYYILPGSRHTPRWNGNRMSYETYVWQNMQFKTPEFSGKRKKTRNNLYVIFKYSPVVSKGHEGKVVRSEFADCPYATRFSTSNPACTWSPPCWMCSHQSNSVRCWVVASNLYLICPLRNDASCYSANASKVFWRDHEQCFFFSRNIN